MKLAVRDWFRRRSQAVTVEPRSPQHRFPVHEHEFGEVVIVASGNGWHLWNDEPQFITGGEVFYIRPQDHHSFEQVSDLHLTNFLYRPSDRLLGGDRIQQLLHDPDGPNRWQLTDDSLRLLQPLIAELTREVRSDDPYSDVLAESLFIQLAAALCRHRVPIDCDRLPVPCRFGHVLAYLRHHCTADVDIDELAHRAGSSPRTFARMFRRITGTTPHNYLVQLRIGLAKRAIRTTGDSITEIAFASGFHDSNYFSFCFGKMTGLSPSEYRRRGAASASPAHGGPAAAAIAPRMRGATRPGRPRTRGRAPRPTDSRAAAACARHPRAGSRARARRRRIPPPPGRRHTRGPP
jgi:AraC family L-rhamnose operon transcriptional activator RhaR